MKRTVQIKQEKMLKKIIKCGYSDSTPTDVHAMSAIISISTALLGAHTHVHCMRFHAEVMQDGDRIMSLA